MRIALISPKGRPGHKIMQMVPEAAHYHRFLENMNKEGGEGFNLLYGITPALPILASLVPKGHDIVIIDENAEEINFTIKYDLVGISIMTHQAVRGYEIAESFKKRGISVIMGGVHATVLPDEAKKHCDSVVIGEAESSWPRVLKDFLSSNLQSFYISEDKVDLTKMPVPRYD